MENKQILLVENKINIVTLIRKLLRVIKCNRVPIDKNLYF